MFVFELDCSFVLYFWLRGSNKTVRKWSWLAEFGSDLWVCGLNEGVIMLLHCFLSYTWFKRAQSDTATLQYNFIEVTQCSLFVFEEFYLKMYGDLWVCDADVSNILSTPHKSRSKETRYKTLVSIMHQNSAASQARLWTQSLFCGVKYCFMKCLVQSKS